MNTDTTSDENAVTPYAMLGGEEVVRQLVARFYDLMELDAEFAQLRQLHPASTEGSREKLFLFLSGWLGGPDLYIQRFGHPRLRARHLPFAITSQGRDQWLRCMAQAMHELDVEEKLQLRLMESFYQTADWMRNTPG